MKKYFLLVFFLFFILIPSFKLEAQTGSNTKTTEVEKTNFPQWAKDIRRLDIIAFGSFPFAMFTATFLSDLYRWNQANSFDFSEQGRRYAPWPIKSAGAVEMTNDEFKRTMMIAAGISLSVAVIDLVIVKLKQNKERKRIESRPPGSAIIITKPIPSVIDDDIITEETAPEAE